MQSYRCTAYTFCFLVDAGIFIINNKNFEEKLARQVVFGDSTHVMRKLAFLLKLLGFIGDNSNFLSLEPLILLNCL
jgi:hypothetical protein